MRRLPKSEIRDRETALNILQRCIGEKEFLYIGEGKEGFVFAGSDRIYKIFRNGKESLGDKQKNFLEEFLSNSTGKLKHILPVLNILVKENACIIESPRMIGEEYRGGHWWGLVEMLKECQERCIALTNIHPDNLKVLDSGLIYVDVGSSVVPLNQNLWKQMVQRAYLSFRYPKRADLKTLLTRSITQELPELNGIVLFNHDIEAKIYPEPFALESSEKKDKTRLNVTLLIRTCYMEWENIEFQVEHIVNSLEKDHKFFEKIVICGSNKGPFTRQYTEPDEDAELAALERLKERALIDRYFIAPEQPDAVGEISRRWFNIDTDDPLSKNGEPTIDTLFGFEQCRTDLILQTDSDIILGGANAQESVNNLIEVLNRNADAVGASLPPPIHESQEYTPSGPNGKWRTEVRFSLINRRKIEALRPLPNSINARRLELSWYRSLDKRLDESSHSFYRGGDPEAFMIHVPNEMKTDSLSLYNIIKAVECGRVLQKQVGSIDLLGSMKEWLGIRKEKLIFVVRGKNTPLVKLHRCIQSLKMQQEQSFGVIFIDAASTNGSAEVLEELCRNEWKDRATFLRNHKPLTVMENNFIAISTLIKRKDAIIVLLDADDALLENDVVSKLLGIYDNGADLTVGSMIRTDKYKEYPVNFKDARACRGGNVWQHLRTFRKYLFDSIAEDDLKVNGLWVPYAEDWAFMLPMVEMANNPFWLRDPVYLYDPDPALRNCTAEEREEMIGIISQKKPYDKLILHK